MASQYWSSTAQPITIFHWTTLLENWNNYYHASAPIETVTINLDRAREMRLPSTHFKKYLNYTEEEDGLKWFLYECIMRKHTWPTLEFGVFIRSITDDISLDTEFPIFPGSPRGITVRAFLQNHMSGLEIDFLDLMPSLVNTDPTPLHQSKNAAFQIRIIRAVEGDHKEDDIIHLSKNGDLFNFSYVDPSTINGKPTRMTVKGLSSSEVLTRLSYTFRLMAVDSLPFEAVELCAPGYPCVVIPVKELDSYTRDLIYDTVDDTMKNWPVVRV